MREAIGSLLAQTYPRLEIVLVNDGSFEEEDWLLAELTAKLPVVLVSQMNSGLGAARNLGVLQARGRYVFPLDCDNVAESDSWRGAWSPRAPARGGLRDLVVSLCR